MPDKYEGLHAWMAVAFGSRDFTIDDFRAEFPSPAPAKVLSDLRRLGYVEGSGRGVYRLVDAATRARRLVESEQGLFGLAERAGLPYGYCDSTAIAIWTGGGYWTGFTHGFRPIHVRVRRGDLPRWRRYLRANGARLTIEGSRETLFGVVHVLHPAVSVRSVEREGVRVVPAREALAWAQARPYAYEPILPALREAAAGVA